jgi:hypothetical protein
VRGFRPGRTARESVRLAAMAYLRCMAGRNNVVRPIASPGHAAYDLAGRIRPLKILWRLALLLPLIAASCDAPSAPEGAPGSLAVHMGGSFTSYAGAVSNSH